MAPPTAPGSMGPPSRPDKSENKATDINDLSDLITASGIDLREEEQYLADSYRNTHQTVSSFTSPFNTQSSSSLSPNNNFGKLSQGNYGQHPAFQGYGPVSQPPVPQKTIEEEVFEKHKRAARAKSENQQQHLRDPFLQPQVLRQKLDRGAYDSGVRVNVEGLYDPHPQKRTTGLTMTGPNGTGIVSVKEHSLLSDTAPLVEVLSLLSLAANERVRGLVEDAFALSRGRQYGSHGVVPPDWADLAVGNGAQTASAVPASITNSAWDQPESAISPMTMPNALKRTSHIRNTQPSSPMSAH
ncbi:hypothetical protein LTR04_004470 [Oleoguttula sp. CCFEE 6159]|nr:hypothetical protein LTR04_004470 [Oleoguttula sp. CCFEE 6159]